MFKNILLRLKKLDWAMTLGVVALIVMGVVFVKSAGSARSARVLQELWIGHAFTALFGLLLYFTLALTDYRKILEWFSKPFYIISLLMLVVVLFFGEERFGGRRWLWFFQPSEIAKLSVIMVVAQVFGRKGPELKKRKSKVVTDEEKTPLSGFRALMLGGVLLGVPAFLILCEPDLGTTLVLVPAIIAMLLASRTCTKWLLAVCLTGLVLVGLVIGTVWSAENSPPEKREAIYAKLPLKEHQIKRLVVFVSPQADIHGVGYNLRQATISIGSGSLSGKGIGKGEQKSLGYLPPAVSMNDFIFAVLAEESGFIGSVLMLGLFLLILLRGLASAFSSEDQRGRLMVIGIVTLIFCHVYVNVGMNIGLMPITGLPLPFISAGRTFLTVVLASLGLVESVSVYASEPERQGFNV
jgi:rod shape determining protein RodA